MDNTIFKRIQIQPAALLSKLHYGCCWLRETLCFNRGSLILRNKGIRLSRTPTSSPLSSSLVRKTRGGSGTLSSIEQWFKLNYPIRVIILNYFHRRVCSAARRSFRFLFAHQSVPFYQRTTAYATNCIYRCFVLYGLEGKMGLDSQF